MPTRTQRILFDIRLTSRYGPARLLCWFLRKMGYSVMLYPDHFGHQAGDVEFDFRTKTGKLLYFAGVTPNWALRRMHARRATIITVPNWLRQNLMEAQVAYECLDEFMSRKLSFYDKAEIWKLPPQLKFSEEEEAYGQSVLKELGLEKGKYVAFHARDPWYGSLHHPDVLARRVSPRLVQISDMTEDHAFQRHRNADFALYYDTIKWLANVGLRAVRLGADVERPYTCDNLTDYAGMRGMFDDPELADLYLMANAKLYVGSGSGVTQLSGVWNTPGVCVNWFPYLPGSRPTANITACRVKRLKVMSKGKMETLSEFRSRHFFELADWPQIYAVSQDIEVIDNTPEEILETVQKALVPNVAKAA